MSFLLTGVTASDNLRRRVNRGDDEDVPFIFDDVDVGDEVELLCVEVELVVCSAASCTLVALK